MTVSDARVSGDLEGDCAGDAPTESSTIGDGGSRASLCLCCSSVVEGSTAPEAGVPSVGSVVIGEEERQDAHPLVCFHLSLRPIRRGCCQWLTD